MEAEVLNNATVAELVANDYRAAEIFKRHGIDFCCGGKKSIASVCKEKNIGNSQLLAEIIALQKEPFSPACNFKDWQAGFLVDYIINVHHAYVNQNLALITEFANKVASVHGGHNPETKEIAAVWEQLAIELSTHLDKEETILFLWIKLLEALTNGEFAQEGTICDGSIKNPVYKMEQEHDVAADLMKKIQELSNNFMAPDYACNTYRVLYAKLKEFQNDLFQHIHLENNILFEKAVILEGRLNREKMA